VAVGVSARYSFDKRNLVPSPQADVTDGCYALAWLLVYVGAALQGGGTWVGKGGESSYAIVISRGD
jgi:hypothetical protein